MSKKLFLFTFALLNISLISAVSGQNRARIAKIDKNQTAKKTVKKCTEFVSGKITENPKPIYPLEAKSAGINGKVEVSVVIDEKGDVVGIQDISGEEVLKKPAADAAKTAKFSPPTCDGVPAKTTGIIIYNFGAVIITKNYFIPASIDDFKDVSKTDNYYESVLFLTENYKIAFGYADGKYHPEMPVSKGDFVEFLHQTLEFLDERTKLSKKELSIYKNYNPYSLKEIEFNPTQPFANSLKILSDKYGIILANEKNIFDGNEELNQNEVIEIWREIFGEESIPMYFSVDKEKNQPMSRGDFAIFLNESLEYLIYKTLP